MIRYNMQETNILHATPTSSNYMFVEVSEPKLDTIILLQMHHAHFITCNES